MQLEIEFAKELASIIKEQFAHYERRIKALEMRQPEKGERGEKGEKGDRGETGIPGRDGKDGRDGINGKDGAGPSRGRHRGPWKHDEQYFLDDSVTWDGGIWIAMVEDAKGKPGHSKEWLLAIKKGRDGKDGAPGPMGPPGRPGKDYA